MSTEPRYEPTQGEKEASAKLIDHAARPRNIGAIRNPDGIATVNSDCDDTLTVYLRLKGNTIKEIRFQVEGCGFTRACGSAVTEIAAGKSLRFALKITAEQIDRALGGLPGGQFHCAELAAKALKAAAEDAIEHRSNPWKRLYRT